MRRIVTIVKQKTIYLDQNMLSAIAKYQSGSKKEYIKELPEICEKIFFNIENGSWFFPIHETHLQEILKYDNSEANSDIIQLFKKQKLKLWNFPDILRAEILLNAAEMPILPACFLKKYDLLLLPGNTLDIKETSETASAKVIEECKKNFIEFSNQFLPDVVLNNDFEKFYQRHYPTAI